MVNNHRLKVLYVSSEVAPFAKSGGLADVAGSLPKTLVQMGHDVRIAMPRYRVVNIPLETILDFPVPVGNRKETAIIRTTLLEEKVPVYFIDNYHYFDRENLYVYEDEAERFAFFCRAVLEMLPALDFQPDVIHCNDWQSGPISVMLEDFYRNTPFYRNIATLQTIHNLHYQGNFPKDSLHTLGLNEYYYSPERLEFYDQISFIKAGLVYADVINTVSRTYAEEIKTSEYGEGQEGILIKRAGDLFGIINGIDQEQFNPASDPAINTHFTSENINLKGENKSFIQRKMGLPIKDVPVFSLISRLVDQKGLDLIEEVFTEFIEDEIQFLLLGTGDPRYEKFFQSMQEKYPDKVSVHIGFNADLAQQIYAGSDVFLMPSKFEPCGLGQIIALRYGTIPIVRATGGLADTICDYNLESGSGNGFVLADYSGESLIKAIKRALKTYRKYPGKWQKLISQSMLADFSWTKSAEEYIKIYQIAIQKRID